MPPARINPYNFTPVGAEPVRLPRAQVRTHERLDAGTYSGRLILSIKTLTPAFVPSRLSSDLEEITCTCSAKCRETRQKRKTTYKRFQHRNSQPLLAATSIKGMVRSVFEALTHSCMPLFASTYSNKRDKRETYPGGKHAHDLCRPAQPAEVHAGNDRIPRQAGGAPY